ncbi:unnamed protein product [Cyclocybe aegerita]|uniref:Uncharacterized protein n=1 Tax=Cyclocybe aegerita TaxID=1973307 RepID=A0A8S0X932_CYCAE|nr:unnamed protein product [Cyclocybe aegerita]
MSAPSTPKKNPNAHLTNARAEPPRASEKQVAQLKQQVQLLEIQMVASDRVRRHLEASIRELTTELEKADGSKQFLEQYKARLMKENTMLSALLKEEAEARRTAEAAQADGVQAMWNKFQKTITEERENYSRLEESKRAVLIQQKTMQKELDDRETKLRDLTISKKQLQQQLDKAKEQNEILKTEASNTKRQLQTRIQEDEVAKVASSNAQSEFRIAVQALKANEEVLQKRYEAAEIERVKAAGAEHQVHRQLEEMERTCKKNVDDLTKALKNAERQIKLLKKEGRESSETNILHQRLASNLEDEREQYQKDLEERDFTLDQTRKKYQAELAQLTEELQSQRDNLSRIREENRKIRSDYDELQLRYDDEVYNSGGWRKERERMETKIKDLERAYEGSTGAQAEQQAQIVGLHSQVLELRGVLNDTEANRLLLLNARRALQAELDTIKMDSADSKKLSSDAEFQTLQLKKQDLERSLEEQEDRVLNANERVKKAEAVANEWMIELDKMRVENSSLERLNASLEKQIKELNVRIVDLETRSYALSPSRTGSTPRRLDSRIEELTNQLQQTSKDRRESLRLNRDGKSQLLDDDRNRSKLESYEVQVQNMRQAMDVMVSDGGRVLSLERELERLHGRLERTPAASASPRK